jgi:hypothetical protein
MGRTQQCFFAILPIVAFAACGGDEDVDVGDSDSGTDSSVVDAGKADQTSPKTDGGKDATDSGLPDTGTIDTGTVDGGDGSTVCNFATYVSGLITTGTSDTTAPTTDLGDNCTDNQSQAEFGSLFP